MRGLLADPWEHARFSIRTGGYSTWPLTNQTPSNPGRFKSRSCSVVSIGIPGSRSGADAAGRTPASNLSWSVPA
jgi:hypothetical protein